MFPYADNFIHNKGFYGVLALILGICTINTPMLIDSNISEWALRNGGFFPLLFSVHPWSNFYTLFTSILIHADIFHLLGNCLFLWVFGRSLEELFGTKLFLLTFPVLGISGLLLHWTLNPDSTSPVIGASGAIATLMGAYLTLFPKARMKMIFTLGIFFKRFTVPAWVFLFYWGGLQLLSLVFSNIVQDNVAYAVHIGGFIVGAMGAIIWKVSYPLAEENLLKFMNTAFSK